MPFSAGEVLGAAALNASLFLKPVRVAIATNVTLASAVENGDTLDGVVLATNDRVALLGQTAGAENGIYTVNASGAPTRALDFDSSAEVLSGMCVVVSEGTANKDSIWQLTTNASITVGTTALVFFPIHLQGTGSPESVVTAPIGATFRRTDGSTGTTLYVKESGTGNTGWVAVGSSGTSATVVRKTADETVTSSTTLQNDDHLTFAIAANEIWTVDYFLVAGAGDEAADIKLDLAIPAGATYLIGVHGLTTGVTTYEGDLKAIADSTPWSLGIDNAVRTTILLFATVVNGATPGNVVLQWAQNASSGTGTTLVANSRLIAHKIA